MTKQDVVEQVASKTGRSKEATKAVIEAALAIIKQQVTGGHTVTFRGFGAFAPAYHKARKARDLGRNATIDVPAHLSPKFYPSEDFKQKVREQNPINS